MKFPRIAWAAQKSTRPPSKHSIVVLSRRRLARWEWSVRDVVSGKDVITGRSARRRSKALHDAEGWQRVYDRARDLRSRDRD